MRIALYGLPCSGKTTLLHKIDFCKVLDGSTELARFSGTIEDKRKSLLAWLAAEENGDYFIDGHYQFVENNNIDVVFSSENEIFDVFMYLLQKPSVVLERMKNSEKNQKYVADTVEKIEKWQKDEIYYLRKMCHENNKDFYVIDDYELNYENFIPFCKDVMSGFSNLNFAKQICEQINFNNKIVTLLDGDKTVTRVDTTKTLLNFSTDIFENNVYTGYQFWIQDKIIEKNFSQEQLKAKAEILEFNHKLLEKVKNPIILSSGLSEIWSDILGKKLGIKAFAGKFVSAETKFFVTKFLKQKGYTVFSYGDSKNDLFMLKEADKGFLVVNSKFSRSLTSEEIKDLEKVNFNHHFLIEEVPSKDKEEVESLISITKSDSGINGNILANAHFELGKKLSCLFSGLNPDNTTIISFERSGHFLADGIYMNFGGRFETYNSKLQDFPKIETENIVLVDGVINNGTTILTGISKIKEQNSKAKIIIATNVINNQAVPKFICYDLYAVRISKNKFTGCKVKNQIGNIGPDTSDRLFNCIDYSFIPEVELSINNNCNFSCKECGFLIPHQVYPSVNQNIIEEHFKCLEILEDKEIFIHSLAILGGEPTLNAAKLEEAVMRFSSLKNINKLELVTNGTMPQNISDKTLSLLNKISVSVYLNDTKFIESWKNYIHSKAPHIELSFRIQKSWDVNSGNNIVSKGKAQIMFENCWYKKHCVTIERNRLFLCSVAPKHASDEDGLLLTYDIDALQIMEYLRRKNCLSYCSKCIPQMGFDKVKSGEQCKSVNVQDSMKKAIEFLEKR